MIRDVIVRCLKGKELTHSELVREVEMRVKGKFIGSLHWYFEWVKLDLEARGIVRRLEGKPEKYLLS